MQNMINLNTNSDEKIKSLLKNKNSLEEELKVPFVKLDNEDQRLEWCEKRGILCTRLNELARLYYTRENYNEAAYFFYQAYSLVPSITMSVWKDLNKKFEKKSENNIEIHEPEQAFIWGWRFHWGIGVKQSYTEACWYYRQAANQGYSLAQNNLGYMYKRCKNYTEAIKWFLLAANQGYPPAQNTLGCIYQLNKNYTTAGEWYLLAANQGNVGGQNNLGYIYQLHKNYTKAMEWYLRAVKQREATAQCNLGYMYQNGFGVKKNDQEAAKWYRLAAEQNDESAKHNLQVLCQQVLCQQAQDRFNIQYHYMMDNANVKGVTEVLLAYETPWTELFEFDFKRLTATNNLLKVLEAVIRELNQVPTKECKIWQQENLNQLRIKFFRLYDQFEIDTDDSNKLQEIRDKKYDSLNRVNISLIADADSIDEIVKVLYNSFIDSKKNTKLDPTLQKQLIKKLIAFVYQAEIKELKLNCVLQIATIIINLILNDMNVVNNTNISQLEQNKLFQLFDLYQQFSTNNTITPQKINQQLGMDVVNVEKKDIKVILPFISNIGQSQTTNTKSDEKIIVKDNTLLSPCKSSKMS